MVAIKDIWKFGYFRPESNVDTILDFGPQESISGHFWCSDHLLSPNSPLRTSTDTFCADTIVTENESRPAEFIVGEFHWAGFISPQGYTGVDEWWILRYSIHPCKLYWGQYQLSISALIMTVVGQEGLTYLQKKLCSPVLTLWLWIPRGYPVSSWLPSFSNSII